MKKNQLVTIFKDAHETIDAHYISVTSALKRIQDGSSKKLVESIRDKYEKGDDSYQQLKVLLPSVVFAGVADKKVKDKKGKDTLRNDECITRHSGFFVIDFDDIETEVIKARLSKDTYVYACWKGVTKGAKALIKCPPNIHKHSEYYNAFLSRYPELDSTSKNIGRLCFESYDPDLFYNPNSQVWDKTLTDEEYQKQKVNLKEKRKKRIMDISASMIRGSRDGEKHEVLLKASRLLGGAVATKLLPIGEATKFLEDEIKKKNPKDFRQAQATIKDGLDYGSKAPLHEIKEIEKSLDFTRREDGTYDFLADESEMDEYESAVINGTLQMGLPTGMPKLDEHWMFKKNTLVWIGGISNIGKSFGGWYKTVLAAMIHDWKFLIYSKENGDGQVRKKIKEFYIGKSIKLFDESEHKLAKEFVQDRFRFFTARKSHTATDFLLKCEIIFDEGWEYDCVFAEPYNAFNVPFNVGAYPYNTFVLNEMQTFTQNYTSIWISDHVGSDAARKKDKDGFTPAPWKSDIEMGAMKDNKAGDFLIYHRYTNDPSRKNVTEIHVQKVKDKETGGEITPIDEPVMLLANKDLCGFSCNGVDPVREYWERKGRTLPKRETSEAASRLQGWEKPSTDELPPF